MPAQLISGNDTARTIQQEIKAEIAVLARHGTRPGLAVVLVGDDPASQVYVRNKRRTCEELGIRSFAHDLPASTSEAELLHVIDTLNNDPAVHGILVQMPLPKHINEQHILDALDPRKDVDGFHPENLGRLLQGAPRFIPCTPAGCIELLLRHGHDPAGRHAVIVGRSNIVGKPLAALLMQKGPGADATVTLCHSRTRNLPDITRQADILVAAIGVPRYITADMVKEGAIVLDVGINRIEDPSHPKGTRLVGDVDFDTIREKAAAITPVPGGVGPMTIAMLMKNTLRAAQDASR